MGSAKLRHRAFALGPLAWEAGLWESRTGFLPVSPGGGGLEAAPDKGCGGRVLRVSFSAGAKERDAAWLIGRHAMPDGIGDGSGRGDTGFPTRPCGVRHGRDACGAFDARVCAYRHSKIRV
jgi:hypothetical protein